MKNYLNLMCSCLITQLLACSPENADVAEKQRLKEDVDAIEATLLRQQTAMDSIIAIEEMEVAQQIIIEQQLIDLKAKMTGNEARLQNSLVSNLKTAPKEPR